MEPIKAEAYTSSVLVQYLNWNLKIVAKKEDTRIELVRWVCSPSASTKIQTIFRGFVNEIILPL